jgi:serine/threonine protein kinase/tetratricopeptide (TPR) repeat protein
MVGAWSTGTPVSESIAGDFWAEVEALFAQAAEAPAAERARLLDARRAQDPQVVNEVESLMAASPQATAFLHTLGCFRAAAATAGTLAEVDANAPTGVGLPLPVGRTGTLEPDRLIGHYRIRQWLGAGGMGEVYRADDIALGRTAALKLLPRRVDPRLRRILLREADASARLQHPAIATFYEAGEEDGEAFIAMEFVEGRLLRQRLADGPLPVEEALGITLSVLEGLAHAHTAGIIHRDIKPENIIVTPSGAKLLDFGIAKRLIAEEISTTPSVDDAVLATGLVGTLGYLAPEQILGEPLHPGTDLFQVGLVLFEMLTGQPAFAGSSVFERLHSVTAGSPNLHVLRSAGLSEALIAVISRALRRDPAQRYSGAGPFIRDLNTIAGRDGSLPATLAVLDFRSEDGTSSDGWIGSGVAERLSTDLGAVQGLIVISRDRIVRAVGSSVDASDGPFDPVRCGRLIGCQSVIAGTFQRTGPLLHLTVTFVDVRTGQTLWTEHFDDRLEAFGEMQEALRDGVVTRLQIEKSRVPVRAGHDIHAFEYYARGRRLWQRLEKGTMDEARELYERAIAIDPHYAQALAGLAAVHAMRFPYTTDPADLEKAIAYARRAIAENPNLSDAYAWLSYGLMRQQRFTEALEVALHGHALDPDQPYPPYFAGCIHYFSGRLEAAVPLLQRAIAAAPTHAFAWMVLGNVHTSLANFSAARWCFERALSFEHPDAAGPTAGVAAQIAECLRLEGRREEARRSCLDALETIERSDHMYRDTFRASALCCLARIAFDQGDLPAARAALQQVVAHVQGRDRMLSGGHLMVQALAGLARAGDGKVRLDEAHTLWRMRTRFDFSHGFSGDATTLTALGLAARALCLPESRALLQQASDAGSSEARAMLEANP